VKLSSAWISGHVGRRRFADLRGRSQPLVFHGSWLIARGARGGRTRTVRPGDVRPYDKGVEILRVRRSEAETARGIVVVIDVLRAFTVAAYALAGGASRLWLVRTAEEAVTLRKRVPDALLAGEIDGRLIPGFDMNNSPSQMAAADVRGRVIIQRTGAGTQGAVGSVHATHLLACSLVNALATVEYVRNLAKTSGLPVTLMTTESAERKDHIEDDICADYVEGLLRDRADARLALDDGIERLLASPRVAVFVEGDGDFPAEDIPAAMAVDRFSFVMVGRREQYGDLSYVDLQRRGLVQDLLTNSPAAQSSRD
jgi:2-phosphosulfolactate phosphatase